MLKHLSNGNFKSCVSEPRDNRAAVTVIVTTRDLRVRSGPCQTKPVKWSCTMTCQALAIVSLQPPRWAPLPTNPRVLHDAALAGSIAHLLPQKPQSDLRQRHQPPCVRESSWQPAKGRSSWSPVGKPFPDNSHSTTSCSFLFLRRPTKCLWRTKIHNHSRY